jgi:hypothetical protein
MRKALILGFVGSFVVIAGCDKKTPGGEMAPAGSGSGAAGESASTLTAVKYSAKPAARGTKPSTQKAFKGGSGATVPSVSSQKLSEASTDRQVRKHAKADMADCKTLPDNAAECDGNNLYFCDDEKLWVVDCHDEAKLGGATAGACFEGEKFIDCLGQLKADDDSEVWCDFQSTVCCDKDGSCYSPKG